MPTLRPLVAGIVAALLLPVAVAIADTPGTTAPVPSAIAREEPAAAPADTAPAARAANPVMLEVRAALDREREQIETLRARLKAKPGEAGALALQREIERVKLDTEVAILRIQAGAARRAGRAALAERLEIAARDLLAPPAATNTATRPAPRAAGR